jgi:hypothetical protein
MQFEVLSESYIWGVLAPRFQAELTLQKSEIWRFSGLLEEYGGTADEDFYREREQKALIEELTGLLVQAVTHEAANRQLTNNSSRRAGRPKDVVTAIWLRNSFRCSCAATTRPADSRSPHRSMASSNKGKPDNCSSSSTC